MPLLQARKLGLSGGSNLPMGQSLRLPEVLLPQPQRVTWEKMGFPRHSWTIL